MPDQPQSVPAPDSARSPRKRWTSPAVTELPKLQNLTLQTGGTIPGDGTVIP